MESPSAWHRCLLGVALAVILASPVARAQSTGSTTASPDTVEQALAVARAAFEYRDFGQVVAALDPWVHPPRIQDERAMIAARRLLGVSRHVLGDERGAREEFAQLLLLDPDHRLDPFVIPPRVVATFEEVRGQLGPALERRGLGLEARRSAEPILHPAVLWMPLGIPQMVQGDAGAGVAFGALQVLGLALNVVAYFRGQSLDGPRLGAPPDPERDVWLGLQYGGLGLLAAAYAGSVVHGHVIHGERGALPAGEPERAGRALLGSGAVGLRF